VAVAGKRMGRNSGELNQQFIPSYFIPDENFYQSNVESLQCFMHSFFHEDENLNILYICFLCVTGDVEVHIIIFALCKLILLVSMTTPGPLSKRATRL